MVPYRTCEVTERFCGSGGRELVHQLLGWWLDPWLLLPICRSVLGQDAEPYLLPVGQTSMAAMVASVCE